MTRFTAEHMPKHSPLQMEPYRHTIGQQIFSDDRETVMSAWISRPRNNFTEGKQSEPISAVDRPINCVTEVEFLQLKYFLRLASGESETQMDYNALIRMINKSWAAPLNFQVKLTRPPKWNKHETICTMKLYCTRFTGCKNPNSCQFSVLIKYDNCSWICADNYRTLNMCHNGHSIDISPAQEASINVSRDKEADTEEMIDT